MNKPLHRQRVIEWTEAQQVRGERVADIQDWFNDPDVQRRIGELICRTADATKSSDKN